MIERKIRLSDTEEVKEFVRAAGKCDFDIDVCCGCNRFDIRGF